MPLAPSLTCDMPEFHIGRPLRNKGMRYRADPPTIEEILAVMGGIGDGAHAGRLRMHGTAAAGRASFVPRARKGRRPCASLDLTTCRM